MHGGGAARQPCAFFLRAHAVCVHLNDDRKSITFDDLILIVTMYFLKYYFHPNRYDVHEVEALACWYYQHG